MFNNKKAFVLDLDGTVYRGSVPIPGAIQFIQKHWDSHHFYFVTNNTSRSINHYVHKLNGMGLNYVTREHLISPVIPLMAYLKENNIERLFCLGTTHLIAELENQGFKCIQVESQFAHVQAVVVGYDTELTYAKISHATQLLFNPDVKYYATHIDKLCPTDNLPLPDIGCMTAFIECATGRRPEKTFGKPSREILESVLAQFSPSEIAIAGDRLYTDRELSKNIGADFVLVLSGETTLEESKKVDQNQMVVVKDLGELN